MVVSNNTAPKWIKPLAGSFPKTPMIAAPPRSPASTEDGRWSWDGRSSCDEKRGWTSCCNCGARPTSGPTALRSSYRCRGYTWWRLLKLTQLNTRNNKQQKNPSHMKLHYICTVHQCFGRLPFLSQGRGTLVTSPFNTSLSFSFPELTVFQAAMK